MYLSFLVINLEGLPYKIDQEIVRCFKSNPKKHENRIEQSLIQNTGNALTVVILLVT